MNGRKALIWGNHDDNRIRRLSCWTEGAFQGAVLSYMGLRFCLSHEPPKRATISPGDTGSVYLHGHTHQKTMGAPPIMDVGLDATDMRPVPFRYIASLVATHEYGLRTLKDLQNG